MSIIVSSYSATARAVGDVIGQIPDHMWAGPGLDEWMRVASHLPTRTFELCVHGLDISAATGVAVDLPAVAVEEAASLVAVTAAERGLGPELLLAMTGRRELPRGFSVV